MKSTDAVNVPKTSKLHIFAVLLGNALEYYDFLIFAYFAVYIAEAFFPAQSAAQGLMSTFGVFAAGSVARPLGALVIGRIADRRGRKPAMFMSFMMVGAAGAGMALTPTHDVIGVWAVVLLVTFRLIQSFALGGEMGAVSAYLVESSPPERRGLVMSLQSVAQACGSACAGGIGYVLAHLLPPDEFSRYGWRIALLIGVLIIPLGLVIRKNLPETLSGEQSKVAPQTAARSPYIAVSPLVIAIGFIALSCSSVVGYSQGYVTTYVLSTLQRLPEVAYVIPIINSVCTVVFSMLSGMLSDRFGRKPVMIVCSIALGISVLPVFLAILDSQSTWVLYLGIGLLVSLGSLGLGPVSLYLAEALPVHIRAGAVGIVYAFATAVFGGSTQFVLTWAMARTGEPLIPAYFWGGAALIAAFAFMWARETAPNKLKRL